jgi:hypothetical protein
LPESPESCLEQFRDENNQLNHEYVCQEPDSTSMGPSVNNLFKQWQKFIKKYRSGNQNNEDDSDGQEDD